MYLKTDLGDIIDRLSIWYLKVEKGVISKEKTPIDGIEKGLSALDIDYKLFFDKLKEINSTLWSLEDDIREALLSGDEKDVFAKAEAIVMTNDRRAGVKKRLNEKVGMDYDPKSYSGENSYHI